MAQLRCTGQDNDCCTENNPCDEHEGDCDNDDQCAGDLICGKDTSFIKFSSNSVDQMKSLKLLLPSFYITVLSTLPWLDSLKFIGFDRKPANKYVLESTYFESVYILT